MDCWNVKRENLINMINKSTSVSATSLSLKLCSEQVHARTSVFPIGSVEIIYNLAIKNSWKIQKESEYRNGKKTANNNGKKTMTLSAVYHYNRPNCIVNGRQGHVVDIHCN